MINQSLLPTWPEIFQRLGEPEPKRNRARCLIHRGDSPTSLCVNEDRGVYHCFVCHASGDKFNFIQRVLGLGFKDALSFLGIAADGWTPAPAPKTNRQLEALDSIREWCGQKGRQLRNELYAREMVITWANNRLRHNPNDPWAWNWLAWAYPGKDRLEHFHTEIGLCRTDTERVSAWRAYHDVL